MRTPKHFEAALLLVVLSAAALRSHGQQTPESRYPLRLHVLAIDDTHPTVRLQPNWCSASVPSGGDDASTTGGSGQGNSCGGSATFGGDDDFSGGGRGDLVTPHGGGTQAISFTYEGCSRVRIPPGFQGLPARWKKPGKLEVLVPTDAIVQADRPSPVQRCTITATPHEFVFLRLRNGSMVKVSQDAFAAKPALRVFLIGGSETLQPRPSPTVSVKQLMQSPQ
jgi:hypothetical protein